MAQYATLKAAIDAVIKANGQREITGTVLNQTLNAMVNSLGADYQFAGVATPSTNPGTPDQNVFYLAGEGGTYSNFNNTVLPNGISILKWNGSWSSQTLFAGDGGVFDISAYKATGGTLATFANLTEALGTDGENIPVKYGGMQVRFVSSSDNKYVQWRLLKNQWSVNIEDWQKIDTQAIVNQNTQLVGNGSSLVVKNLNDIVKGHSYRVYIPEIDITGLSLEDTNSVFAVVQGTGFLYNLTKKDYDDGNIPEYVDVLTDAEGSTVAFRIRAVVGYTTTVTYFDIDTTLNGAFVKIGQVNDRLYHTAYFTGGATPTFTFGSNTSFNNMTVTMPNGTMYIYQFGKTRTITVSSSDTFTLENYQCIVLRSDDSLARITLQQIKEDDILLLGCELTQVSGALALYVYAKRHFDNVLSINALKKSKYLFSYLTDASKPDFYINPTDNDKKIILTLPTGKTLRIYSIDGTVTVSVTITSSNNQYTIPIGSYLIYKNNAFSVVDFRNATTEADYILLSYDADGVVDGLLAPYYYDWRDAEDKSVINYRGTGNGANFKFINTGITKSGLYRVYIPTLQIDSSDILDSQNVFSIVFYNGTSEEPQPESWTKAAYPSHPVYVDINLPVGNELRFRIRANSGTDFSFNVIDPDVLSQGESIRISAIENNIKELQEDNIITRNKDKIANIYAGADAWRGYSPLKKNFALLVFTDLHADDVRLNNALYLLDNCDVIDAGIFLGDMEQGTAQTGTFIPDTAVPAINAAQKDVLAVLGNHDQRMYPTDTITVESSVSRFMGALTKVSSDYQTRGYGYQDFTDYKIRIIMLNPYDYPDDKDANDKCIIFGNIPMYQQAQINWLVNTLNSVPEGYTVIVATHYPDAYTPDNTVIPTHPNTSRVAALSTGDNGYQDGSVISDIINAYKNKTTLVHSYNYITRTEVQNGVTYTHTCPTPSMPSTLDVNADFSSAHGTFACFIFGHIHNQVFAKMVAHNDQIAYGNDASHCWRQSTGYWTSYWSLTPRNKDSVTQDLVSVLCVDTDNKMINIVRIGATTTMFGEKYEIINFSYA